jgi:hypothetical protein
MCMKLSRWPKELPTTRQASIYSPHTQEIHWDLTAQRQAAPKSSGEHRNLALDKSFNGHRHTIKIAQKQNFSTHWRVPVNSTALAAQKHYSPEATQAQLESYHYLATQAKLS